MKVYFTDAARACKQAQGVLELEASIERSLADLCCQSAIDAGSRRWGLIIKNYLRNTIGRCFYYFNSLDV